MPVNEIDTPLGGESEDAPVRLAGPLSVIGTRRVSSHRQAGYLRFASIVEVLRRNPQVCVHRSSLGPQASVIRLCRRSRSLHRSIDSCS